MDTPPNKVWTYDDLLKLPDDGTRYEIIDGELVVMSSPSVTHQRVLQRLYLEFHAQVQQRGQGEVFLAPLDVIMAPTRVVEPDLIVVRPNNRGILKTRIEGIPDLLVEIISPSNHKHDIVTKRRLYARARVPEYWIVDPDAQTIEVLELVEGGLTYRQAGWYGPNEDGPGDRATSASFELAIDIDRIFGE